VPYVQSRLGYLARRHRFDPLIAALAIQAIIVVAVRRDAPDAPQTTPWFGLPAIAAAYWLVAVVASFVDGRLVPFPGGLCVLGMATAFLLGNLRNALQARLGAVIVVGGAAIIIYNLPAHSAAEQVFVPLGFGISWLAGFALRERGEQAEAADLRAAQAEREREAGARIAVAEERVRIARELHDIVAHAVSVMVLQIGAVRHKLLDALAESADALRGVETDRPCSARRVANRRPVRMSLHCARRGRVRT
jgi:signal transduction histidine kinase